MYHTKLCDKELARLKELSHISIPFIWMWLTQGIPLHGINNFMMENFKRTMITIIFLNWLLTERDRDLNRSWLSQASLKDAEDTLEKEMRDLNLQRFANGGAFAPNAAAAKVALKEEFRQKLKKSLST